MGDQAAAAEMLLQMKALGIRIAIDDYGTGYSSLGYLHNFPLDTLKIDHAFMRAMGMDGEGSEIVRTILTLAENLGLDVIAEGVEANHSLDVLKKMRCKYGQ